jgi:hypothetical protein
VLLVTLEVEATLSIQEAVEVLLVALEELQEQVYSLLLQEALVGVVYL